MLQGGCRMTLADATFCIALMTVRGVRDPAVALEMKTNFLAGATGSPR
jgi:acyl-coenzyme A thioesterase PaaI-like protein